MKRIICIDFDGTIVEESKYPSKPKLIKGAKEAIDSLKEKGFYIKIYSCRNNPDIFKWHERWNQMISLLSEYDIYYDEIVEDIKPVAIYFIDDKAIKFKSWKKVLKQIK